MEKTQRETIHKGDNVSILKEGITSATEVSKCLLSLDSSRQYFTLNTMRKKEGWGSLPTEGNFRLNKILHMCQIFYCVKYKKPLFKEPMSAFEHGAIVYDIYMGFTELYSALQKPAVNLEEREKNFIKKVFNYFHKFDDLSLWNFSHEDPAWQLGREQGKAGLMPLNNKLVNYYSKFFDDTFAEIGA